MHTYYILTSCVGDLFKIINTNNSQADNAVLQGGTVTIVTHSHNAPIGQLVAASNTFSYINNSASLSTLFMQIQTDCQMYNKTKRTV